MRSAVVIAACTIATSACAAMPSPPSGQAGDQAAGYISEATIEALAAAVPAPPAQGSAADVQDRAASERLRAVENTDRWLLATRHAELRPGLALAHFDCALGFRLSADDAPRLVSILERVLHDANESAERAKARAFRPRPVGVDADRSACTVVSAAGRASPSYPSGSATVGTAYGQVMAALVPERAEALSRIGHEIAVSRMVCAMHYPADVQAGARLGQAVFDQIASSPAFAEDAGAARLELDRARAAGLTSPACAAERAALATPLP